MERHLHWTLKVSAELCIITKSTKRKHFFVVHDISRYRCLFFTMLYYIYSGLSCDL